jgi:hypothetical protein
MFLIAPAGFGRIRLAEAVSIPGVRHATERALPLALGHRLPVTLAYRGLVTNNVAPQREVLERVMETDAKVVAAAVCVTRAIVAASAAYISDLIAHLARLIPDLPALRRQRPRPPRSAHAMPRAHPRHGSAVAVARRSGGV